MWLAAWPALASAQTGDAPSAAPPGPREALARTLPRLARHAAEGKAVRVLVVAQDGREKTLAQELRSELPARLGTDKLTVDALACPSAALAAWTLGRAPQEAKAELTILCLGLPPGAAAEAAEDFAASCAWLAQHVRKAGGQMVIVIPTGASPSAAEGLREACELAWVTARAAEGSGAVIAHLPRAVPAAGSSPEAQACLDAIFNPAGAGELSLTGRAEWTPRGLAVRLEARNDGAAGVRRALTLAAFGRAPVQGERSLECDLEPGASATASLVLPDIRRPEVAAAESAARAVLARGAVELLVQGACSRAGLRVPAWFEPLSVWVERTSETAADYRLPLRLCVRNGSPAPVMAQVTASQPGRASAKVVQEVLPLPASSCGSSLLTLPADPTGLGRKLHVVVEVREGACPPAYALAEADLLRFAQCGLIQDPRIEGDLAEWEGRLFAGLSPAAGEAPAGRSIQFTTGYDAETFYVAVRSADAQAEGARVDLLLDPRPAAELGTPGGGMHVQARLEAAGKVSLFLRGSAEPLEARGAWKQSARGLGLELAIPRAVLSFPAFADGGDDLGMNLAWVDGAGAYAGKSMVWATGGEDWSSRSAGRVRRSRAVGEKPTLQQLPLLVRWR